jgi:hypothetical protein
VNELVDGLSKSLLDVTARVAVARNTNPPCVERVIDALVARRYSGLAVDRESGLDSTDSVRDLATGDILIFKIEE